jgi:hypothetical protein
VCVALHLAGRLLGVAHDRPVFVGIRHHGGVRCIGSLRELHLEMGGEPTRFHLPRQHRLRTPTS